MEGSTEQTILRLPVRSDRRSALPQLFRPSYRAVVRPSRQGLGRELFIAHRIALSHGSTPDGVSAREETRFMFRVPIG